MKNTFAPIFTRMLDSSVWEEPLHVRVLWVSMLALKDSDHVVRFQPYHLHKRANLTQAEVEDALKILSQPDKRRAGQEFDGRRIEKTEDGWWKILNGQLYEDEMRRLSRNVYQARKQREYREARKAVPRGKPLPGESAALAAGDEEVEDRIAAERRPMTAKRRAELLAEFERDGKSSPSSKPSRNGPVAGLAMDHQGEPLAPPTHPQP